jgi:molybdopterin-biosynthesis enzyme MoeA-like protein
MRTAAALIIGNEVLTGKVQEENVAPLARELFSLGVSLRRVVVCPDEIDVIVSDLNALRSGHDHVFTSGGVGPTHDDVTIPAVAAAFGRAVVRSAELEAQIRGYFHGRPVGEEHLRMAEIPEGAELLRTAEVPWPTVVIDNVYVLPGVPQAFRMKLVGLRERLRTDSPFVSEAVYTLSDEAGIAALLTRLAAEHPSVLIGSYVKWRDPEYKTKVTFDGRDPDAVKRAADALVAALPPAELVRRS